MTFEEERKTEERFARAWERWSERPLKKQPGQAARDILLLLEKPQPSNRPFWVPVAAAAALMLALGGSLMWRSLHTRNVHAPAPPLTASSVREGEVLMWLDDRTPLYMTFQGPEGPGGKQ